MASTKIAVSSTLTDVQALYADVKKQQADLLAYRTELEASLKQTPHANVDIKLPEVPINKEADQAVANKLQSIQQSLKN